MADEIKPEVIKKTQDLLGKYIKKPPLTEKLLKKPPFRFLHDIITNVIRETGFLNGVFAPEELSHENIKDREGKIAFLQKTIDAVKSITGSSFNVRPSKIVAGHEPARTNELLQAIGKALDRKLDSADYVANLGKQNKTEKKEKSKTANKEERRSKARDRSRSKELSKGPPPSIAAPSQGAPAAQKQRRSRTKEGAAASAVPSVTSSEAPRAPNEAPSAAAPAAAPAATNEPSAVERPFAEGTAPEALTPQPPTPLPSTAQGVTLEAKAEEVEALVAEAEGLAEENATTRLSPDAFPAESALPTAANSPAKKLPSHDKKKKAAKGSSGPIRATRETVVAEAERESTTPETMGVFGAKTSVETPSASPVPARTTTARPTTARPRTARPPSARPAAPRVRDRGHVVLQEDLRTPTGKVEVITDDTVKEQDEFENFVVVESPMLSTLDQEAAASSAGGGDGLRGGEGSPAPEGPHGHLVAQILETQRDLEGSATTRPALHIEWGEGRRREREAAGKEVERLRASIQTLTRAANPLGKLMDFLQEDVDAMQRELEGWRESNRHLAAQLAQEQRRTEELVEPLRMKLESLEQAVGARRDEISAVKAAVQRSDARLQRLAGPNAATAPAPAPVLAVGAGSRRPAR